MGDIFGRLLIGVARPRHCRCRVVSSDAAARAFVQIQTTGSIRDADTIVFRSLRSLGLKMSEVTFYTYGQKRIFLCISRVHSENAQRVTNVNGKPRRNYIYF